MIWPVRNGRSLLPSPLAFSSLERSFCSSGNHRRGIPPTHRNSPSIAPGTLRQRRLMYCCMGTDALGKITATAALAFSIGGLSACSGSADDPGDEPTAEEVDLDYPEDAEISVLSGPYQDCRQNFCLTGGGSSDGEGEINIIDTDADERDSVTGPPGTTAQAGGLEAMVLEVGENEGYNPDEDGRHPYWVRIAVWETE